MAPILETISSYAIVGKYAFWFQILRCLPKDWMNGKAIWGLAPYQTSELINSDTDLTPYGITRPQSVKKQIIECIYFESRIIR